MTIETITAYRVVDDLGQPVDGELFVKQVDAQRHQAELNALVAIQQFLNQGPYQSLPQPQKEKISDTIIDWERWNRQAGFNI